MMCVSHRVFVRHIHKNPISQFLLIMPSLFGNVFFYFHKWRDRIDLHYHRTVLQTAALSFRPLPQLSCSIPCDGKYYYKQYQSTVESKIAIWRQINFHVITISKVFHIVKPILNDIAMTS